MTKKGALRWAPIAAVAEPETAPAMTAEEDDSDRSCVTSHSQGSVAEDRRASTRSRGRARFAEADRGSRDRSVSAACSGSTGVQTEISSIVGDSASEAGQEVRGESSPKAPNHGDDTPQSRLHAARNEEP